MTPHRSVSDLLAIHLRRAGGAVLLTHYGPAGERTELSVASFANWVAKTVNLLADLDVTEGDVVALPVLVERPAHWMGLVWPFALWQAGLAVTLDPTDADVAVLGPQDPRPIAPTTLACSLDPWGRALTDLPDGVLDYSSEALAQPDAAPHVPVDPADIAWRDAECTLTVTEVAGVVPVPDRILARPTQPWESVSHLVAAISGGGSVVLVETDADPARTAAAERARVVA